MSIRRIFIFAVTITFSACDSTLDEGTPPGFVILATLVSGKLEQQVYMYRTTPVKKSITDPTGLPADLFVNNAAIRFYDPEGLLKVFSLRRDSLASSMVAQYYGVDSFGVLPFTCYRLLAEVANELLQGITVVPGDFVILKPPPNASIVGSNGSQVFEVGWTSSASALGYEVEFLFLGRDYLQRNATASLMFQTNDTMLVRSVPSQVQYPDSCIISVFAYDSNYGNYRYGSKDAQGIRGGSGYCGSKVVRSVTVRLH